MRKVFRVIAIIGILFLIIGSVFVTMKEEFTTPNPTEDNICKMLYETGDNLEYKVIKNFLTDEFCDDFLRYAKQYAKKNGWTQKRHEHYPTTDNLITESWPQYEMISSFVREKIFSAISKMYPVLEEDLGITEMFVVKYEPEKQSYLEEHEDGSEFSFVIALNDDYEGGGTFFPHLNKLLTLKKGDVLIFSGQNRHRGEPVVAGIRYILTGFLFYREKDYCKE